MDIGKTKHQLLYYIFENINISLSNFKINILKIIKITADNTERHSGDKIRYVFYLIPY